MNEYLVEDEYSFYEIDSECKIELLKEEKSNHQFRKAETDKENCLTADGCGEEKILLQRKRRSNRYRVPGCSCLFVYLFVMKTLLR